MDLRKRVPIIITLVATCVVTNYALVGLPNITLMDFIVFIGGFSFGPIIGATIGMLSWAIYGFFNPYGFMLQIYLATLFSEAMYGVIGGILGKSLASTDLSLQRFKLCNLFGICACAMTLIYDIFTNVVFALSFQIPIVFAIIFGVPFMLVHILSNVAIFSFGSIPLINSIRKIVK